MSQNKIDELIEGLNVIKQYDSNPKFYTDEYDTMFIYGQRIDPERLSVEHYEIMMFNDWKWSEKGQGWVKKV